MSEAVNGSGLSPHYQQIARFPMHAAADRSYEFSPTAWPAAAELIAAGPHGLYAALLEDQESEPVALAALRMLHALLPPSPPLPPSSGAELAAELLAEISSTSAALAPSLATLAELTGQARTDVLRERAPVALLGDCWLDSVSQAATQPAPVVNRLFRHQFADRGGLDPRAAQGRRRRRRLEDLGVALPHLLDFEFLTRTAARPVTAWHGCGYLALGRYGASFLPELIGLHCAHKLLAVDERLLGLTSTVDADELSATLTEFLCFAAGDQGQPRLVQQVADGVRAGLALELEHVALLVELAEQVTTASLDARVAAMLARHARFAGRQHRQVRLGGELLTELLEPEHFDAVDLMRRLRSSRQVKPFRGQDARLLQALRFGGPMFGIFDDTEAQLLESWIAEIQAGAEPEPDPRLAQVGEAAAAEWQVRVAGAEVPALSLREPAVLDDREMLYRLVNVERFGSVLPMARRHAERVLEQAAILFQHGAAGRYTNASWFDYSADALTERVERIYFDKLVEPYRPLTSIGDLDEVVFGQKTFALGSLIDGSWAHRIGRVGRFDETADQMLWAIYADEMGRGDIRKNHITLIYRALASFGIELPHLADPAFLEQAELPDSLYGFSLYQLSLSLFPDSMHAELLGYNLGIEMFGLGEMRMHEMQKLRHHGLDDCYEAAHLSIDNVSAGHARQSTNIIIAHLDRVRRVSGPQEVHRQWLRIWTGYASFAYFIEHALVRSITLTAAPDLAELTL